VDVRLIELSDTDAPAVGALAWPDDTPGAAPAVVVIGGSGGGDEPARVVAAEFADSGIPALALAYFGAPGVPERFASISIEYFAGAAAWLGKHRGSDPARVAMLGMSRGSEAALLTGAHFPTLVGRVVAVVPSNIVCAGFPDGGPAWTLGGAAVPYSRTAGPDTDDPDAVIPVERITGPVLAIGAGYDQIWPSLPMAKAIGERMEARGHTHGHEILEYPNAGHGLSIPAPLGMSTDADQDARLDAWPRILRFVRGEWTATPR
jgi:dienelactone hydrolase